MQTVTAVRFTKWEAEIMDAAMLAAHIGFPNPVQERKGKGNPDWHGHSAIRALTHRDLIHADMLERAYAALIQLRKVVEIETHRDYWNEKLSENRPVVTLMAVPLVADREKLIDVIEEARERQLVEVDRALALVVHAMKITGPPQEIDPESERDGNEDNYHWIMEAFPMPTPATYRRKEAAGA